MIDIGTNTHSINTAIADVVTTNPSSNPMEV
jgi:hypothetical protein